MPRNVTFHRFAEMKGGLTIRTHKVIKMWIPGNEFVCNDMHENGLSQVKFFDRIGVVLVNSNHSFQSLSCQSIDPGRARSQLDRAKKSL